VILVKCECWFIVNYDDGVTNSMSRIPDRIMRIKNPCICIR